MKRHTLAVGLLALSAASAFGQARLAGIETQQSGDALRLVIKGEGLTNPRTTRVLRNTAYIVEFHAHLSGKPGYQKLSYPGVTSVQYGWYRNKPAIVRVMVRLDGGLTPVLSQDGGQWSIQIGGSAIKTPTDIVPKAETKTTVKSLNDMDREAMAQAQRQLSLPAVQPVTASATSIPTSTSLIGAQGTIRSTPILASKIETGVPQQRQQMVSLDFVGTDVVQILKALSIQAGVNIVSSPEVSPSDKPVKLTISLNNVDLESALSYVTAMAGLRYAKINNTFVVTPSANFSSAMRQIMERNASSYTTRVVNLMSGEAQQIRDATLKALPPDGRNGYYEIIVPGDNEVQAMEVASGNTAPATEGAAEGQAGGQTGTEQTGKSPAMKPKKNRAYYLMVVGDPNRMGAIEQYIRDLDMKVAASFSLSRAQSTGTVAIPIQSGQTVKIKDMINTLLADNPRASDYSITETSVKELELGEQATKFLLMIGPENELVTLKNFAVALDKELCRPLGIAYVEDSADLVKDYEVVELKFMEPIVAAQDLKGRFKDLWVTVVPDSVTPGLLGEGESSKDEGPTDSGAAGGGQTASKDQKSDLKKIIGREPMRLILRGSRSTIDEAKTYLAKVDVAPRQIALELRVMELTKEEALKYGIDWSLGLGGTGSVTVKNAPTGLATATGSIGSLTVTGVLDSINNGRNIVARPNALVSDGRGTRLFVGDTIRYIKQIQATNNGITVVTDEIQVGTTFDIKARIGDEGAIALDLMQNFSLLTAFIDVPGGGSLPQTSDRQTNMFVNMRSGETVAIGGLILDQDIKNVSGIPFLKDLPIIGKFFSKTDHSRRRNEIVFFLTAVEVNQQNRSSAASPRVNSMANPDPAGEYKKTGVNTRGGG